MSVVITLRNENTIHIGFDSLLTSGNNKFRNDILDGKVIALGYQDSKQSKHLYVAAVGPHKVQNIVKYEIKLPFRNASRMLDEYIYTEFVQQLRNKLVEQSIEMSYLLIVAEDRIFKVWNDFSMSEVQDEFYSIGSGSLVARGALEVATGIYSNYRDILKAAFKACTRHINNVGGNFYSVDAASGKIDLYEIETVF